MSGDEKSFMLKKVVNKAQKVTQWRLSNVDALCSFLSLLDILHQLAVLVSSTFESVTRKSWLSSPLAWIERLDFSLCLVDMIVLFIFYHSLICTSQGFRSSQNSFHHSKTCFIYLIQPPLKCLSLQAVSENLTHHVKLIKY